MTRHEMVQQTVIVILVTTVACGTAIADPNDASTSREAHIAAVRQAIQDSAARQKNIAASVARGQRCRIEFYGKVIDDSGKPVAGANVHTDIGFVLPAPEFRDTRKGPDVTTDADGLFVVKEAGAELFVGPVERDGYEFLKDPNSDSFNYFADRGDVFVPDKNMPVIFHMRKKGPLAFVVTKHASLRANSRDIGGDMHHAARRIDLLGEWIDEDGAKHNPGGRHHDIEASADLAEDGSAYTIRFTVIDPNDGIMMSGQQLYEAPSSGYVRELVWRAPATERHYETTSFIYFRGRGNTLHSRLVLYVVTRNEPSMDVDVSCTSNPVGTNLEYDPVYSTNESFRRYALYQEQAKEKARIAKERRSGRSGVTKQTDPNSRSMR